MKYRIIFSNWPGESDEKNGLIWETRVKDEEMALQQFRKEKGDGPFVIRLAMIKD